MAHFLTPRTSSASLLIVLASCGFGCSSSGSSNNPATDSGTGSDGSETAVDAPVDAPIMGCSPLPDDPKLAEWVERWGPVIRTLTER